METENTRLASSTSAEQYSSATPSSAVSDQPAFGQGTINTASTGPDFLSTWWPIPKRYIVALMAFLGFANIYALRVNLSVAIVAMTVNRTKIINGTETVLPPQYTWSTHLQGQVLAAFFYGYIISQLPGGFLSQRFGGKYFYGGGVVLTAILTLVTPVLTSWSVYLLLATRVFEGIFEGVTYPAMHTIWSKWAPPQEKTRLATFAFAGSYFGTVVALPASGALANSASGWPSIFYVFGFLAVVWFFLWCLLVTESPAAHRSITNAELDYIQQSIGYTDEQSKRVHPPWLRMLTSAPVWAIVMAHFAENWGFYTWLTELPSFLRHVLKVDIVQSGFYGALPYLIMCIIVIFGGVLADMLRNKFSIHTVTVRKIFTCGAFAVQAIFMVAAGYVMTKAAAITCLTVAVGIGGFAWSGFSVNHLDIAPQFAGILMGMSNTFATLPGIVSPALTGAVVTDQESGAEWQIIFYLAAGIYTLGAVVYGLLASGDRQDWAQIPMGYQPHLDDPEKDQ